MRRRVPVVGIRDAYGGLERRWSVYGRYGIWNLQRSWIARCWSGRNGVCDVKSRLATKAGMNLENTHPSSFRVGAGVVFFGSGEDVGDQTGLSRWDSDWCASAPRERRPPQE